jgi:acyl-CoA thioesterase FadM
VTGTTRITTLVPQMRDKKLVMTQRATDANDLTAGQMITVIFATPKGEEPVLLSGIVDPSQ